MSDNVIYPHDFVDTIFQGDKYMDQFRCPAQNSFQRERAMDFLSMEAIRTVDEFTKFMARESDLYTADIMRGHEDDLELMVAMSEFVATGRKLQLAISKCAKRK